MPVEAPVTTANGRDWMHGGLLRGVAGRQCCHAAARSRRFLRSDARRRRIGTGPALRDPFVTAIKPRRSHDEGAVLARQGRHPLRDGARPEDRASARRHHQGDGLRDLRFRPAHLTTASSRRWKAATSSATRPWARWSRSAPENKKLKVGDRVVVPFTISCGECFFCKRGFYSGCERSNPDKAKAAKLWGHSPAGLFGYSHLLGGYAGGQAEYLRVPFADVGPIKVPDGPERRAGAVPLRHLSDRLHGRRVLQHQARRHDRRSGAAARSGSSRSAAPSCSAPSA